MTDARIGRAGRHVLRDGEAPVRTVQIAREVLRDGAAPVHVAQAAREVARDGQAPVHVAQLARRTAFSATSQARVTQLRRMIVRSRRDSPYPHFPTRLFCPPSLSARLEGGAVAGGVSAAGEAAIEAMDAGGRWVMSFGETPLWDAEKVRTWRMFSTAADMGVMPMIVPAWDRLYQPFANPKYTGATTFGQVVWRDTQVWEADEVQAAVVATTPAHARQLAMSFTGGQPLAGGEYFSIYGSRYGWRLYMVISVLETVDEVSTCEIRPPLREWVRAGTRLNFDTPRCTMRAEGDLSETVELLRFGRGTATFVETFNRYP